MFRAPAAAVVLGACAACAVPPAPHVEPTLEQWLATRDDLAKMRSTLASKPFVAQISVAMHDPRSGRTFDGRGAVAVDRARGVRMILLGPAGATAVDAWVTRDRYRFAVPAIDVVRRGRGDEPEARVLPVGFFRWWFLAPLEGQLLTFVGYPDAGTWVLRDGDATSELSIVRGDAVYVMQAVRHAHGRDETLAWRARSFAPRAGDSGTYRDSASGFAVDVRVDAISDDPPSPEAFADPDAESAR
jgi:hypothetical protein